MKLSEDVSNRMLDKEVKKMESFDGRTDRRIRASGIEMLKIFAIFFVVISHVVQTLAESEGVYRINLTLATTNLQYLVLSVLQYSGMLGNSIFFVCSAWFLLDMKKCNLKKLLHLWLEVWTVSVIIFLAVLAVGDVHLGGLMILRCFLPTVFDNNWYISCYMIFYLIVPFLNIVLEHLTQRQLLAFNLVTLILCCIKFIFIGFAYPFYINFLILWIIIYFWISYLKRYMTKCVSGKKCGYLCFTVGVAGYVGMIVAANYLGLANEFFSDSLLRWNDSNNPFIILAAIGLLLIAKNMHIHSTFINQISSLSLLVYVIHENILLRKYYRPKIFDWLYATYGYDHIVLWVMLFVIGIFTVSILISFCYQQTVGRTLVRFENRIYPHLVIGWNRMIDVLEKVGN